MQFPPWCFGHVHHPSEWVANGRLLGVTSTAVLSAMVSASSARVCTVMEYRNMNESAREGACTTAMHTGAVNCPQHRTRATAYDTTRSGLQKSPHEITETHSVYIFSRSARTRRAHSAYTPGPPNSVMGPTCSPSFSCKSALPRCKATHRVDINLDAVLAQAAHKRLNRQRARFGRPNAN